MKKIAILASGNGSNFEALAAAAQSGKINAEVALLVCDKPHANVISRAKRLGVPAFICNPKDYPNRAAYESRVLEALHDAKVEFIALAGYMRIVGKVLLDAYGGRMVNIHPSMLPEFPGLEAIARAYESGATQTGVTVHYVDAGVDTGPIIVQEAIGILPGDNLESLESRVHEVEHRLYIQVLKDIFI